MNKKNALVTTTLCLIALGAGIAIAEYALHVPNHASVRYDTTFVLTWKNTTQTVGSIEWGDITDISKDSPRIILTHIGNTAGCNVLWNTVNLPSCLVMAAYSYTHARSWEPNTPLEVTQSAPTMDFKLSLRDTGAQPGDYTFEIVIASAP